MPKITPEMLRNWPLTVAEATPKVHPLLLYQNMCVRDLMRNSFGKNTHGAVKNANDLVTSGLAIKVYRNGAPVDENKYTNGGGPAQYIVLTQVGRIVCMLQGLKQLQESQKNIDNFLAEHAYLDLYRERMRELNQFLLDIKESEEAKNITEKIIKRDIEENKTETVYMLQEFQNYIKKNSGKLEESLNIVIDYFGKLGALHQSMLMLKMSNITFGGETQLEMPEEKKPPKYKKIIADLTKRVNSSEARIKNAMLFMEREEKRLDHQKNPALEIMMKKYFQALHNILREGPKTEPSNATIQKESQKINSEHVDNRQTDTALYDLFSQDVSLRLTQKESAPEPSQNSQTSSPDSSTCLIQMAIQHVIVEALETNQENREEWRKKVEQYNQLKKICSSCPVQCDWYKKILRVL
ncbi:MAG: hypothetical protein LBH79_02645 [Nitrososphaerota archaeon]|jgi:hypothetical protein|nr:hypothetical protein [Nitrososphaerota archaeon]